MRDRFIKERQARLGAGTIDRRQFITSAVAAGLTLPAAISLSDKVFAQTPKRGGHLRQGFSAGSSTESLDALKSNGSIVEICNNWCWGSNLTEVQPDGSIAPELAETMESSDGKTWVFNLRPGVEFHNGKSLTPEDVIHSVNRHRGEDSQSAVKSLFEPVADIRKGGDNQVIIELESANADFPFVLSDYRLIIMPSDDSGAVDISSGNGTGPYVLETFDPGVRTEFKRNPNYFKSDRAHFDEVEGLVLIDPTARQAALIAGKVDLVDNVDPTTVHLLTRSPGINILEVTGMQHRTMVMRLDTPPFDNFDLRMANKTQNKK